LSTFFYHKGFFSRHSRQISALLILLLTVVVAALVSFSGVAYGLYVLIGFIGITTFLLALFNPYFGFNILLVFSFFMFYPDRLLGRPIPTGIAIEVITLITIIAVMMRNFVQRKLLKPTLAKTITIIFLIYTAYQFIEIFNPHVNGKEGVFFFIRKYTAIVLIYFISLHVFDSLDRIRFYFKMWVFLAFLVGLYACKQQWFGFFGFEESWLMSDPHKVRLYYQGGMFRKWSFVSDPAACGILLGISTLVSVIMALNETNKRHRFLLWIASIFIILGMVYTGTRTAYVILVPGFLVYIIMNLTDKRVLVFAVSLLVAVLFVMIGPVNSPSINRIRSLKQGTNEGSVQYRDENRHAIQPYIWSHPIGGGLTTSGVEGFKYNPGHPLAGFPPDSGFLKITIETGWIGLFLLCLLYFIILQQSVHFHYKAADKEIRTYYSAITASLFAFVIAHYGQVAIGQMPGVFYFFPVMAIICRMIEFDTKKTVQ
jgi:hypothetical protein